MLYEIGAVPFETDPRSFDLVWRHAHGQRVKTFWHAHVDDLPFIGQEGPYLMGKIEDRVRMTWKGLQPKSFCGVQYAYGAGNETIVYMKDSAGALLALCRSSGIDVGNLPKPLTPMTVGRLKISCLTLPQRTPSLPMIFGTGQLMA